MHYPMNEILAVENYEAYMAKVIKKARNNPLLTDRETFFTKSPHKKIWRLLWNMN